MNFVDLYRKSTKYNVRVEILSDIKDFVSVYQEYYFLYMQWLDADIQGNGWLRHHLSDELYELMREFKWKSL